MFSHLLESGEMSEWITIPSEFSTHIIDTSGAGDWLTAGFISELYRSSTTFEDSYFSNRNKLIQMLRQGMRYSQLCSAVIGAQGAFYSRQSLQALWQLNQVDCFNISERLLDEITINNSNLCPICFGKVQSNCKFKVEDKMEKVGRNDNTLEEAEKKYKIFRNYPLTHGEPPCYNGERKDGGTYDVPRTIKGFPN